MASPIEPTISNLQKRLEVHIKPREQVNYIRRVLALELGSYTSDGPIQQPLSLNDDPIRRSTGPELRGIHKEYIDALRDNISVRQQFDEASQKKILSPKPVQKGGNAASAALKDHLTVLTLSKKRDSLVTVQNYLKRLSETPIATQGSLDIDQILKDGKAHPSVPREVLNSFVVEQSSPHLDLNNHVTQLEKTVLRAKLLLKQYERLLAEARARCKTKPELVSNGAKLQALNKTRDELINWIETELSKAATDEKAHEDASTQEFFQDAFCDQAGIKNQLQRIQDKYQDYISARRELLALVSHTRLPLIPPPVTDTQSAELVETSETISRDYLLIPHIETLLSQSRRQKSYITLKSHITEALGKQSKGSYQVLSRLAEESQLLPAYPMKNSIGSGSNPPDMIEAKPAERPDMASRVTPWISAVDAAKIGALEAVAEKVEAGQVALENSMETLHKMAVLLGAQEDQEEIGPRVDTTEEDMWLHDGIGQDVDTKKPLKKKRAAPKVKSDPWARLHGNLGLIGHDDVPQ
ncbi:hypothetical protein QQS21_012479 [Conoideocrella luteorostrata]|uniref:Uncharacterized protein n=1 Tax=Conoideocrella luteorostrata TaxID=1105319 RepID=A0AAJ0FMB7_9HYPO|nr:hypothetical protein QQS21_012479 [Conoideocrella luteorostrata]